MGHVAGKAGSSAKGRGLVLHALGQLVKAVPCSFVPLGLAGHLAVACLDAFFLHGQGSVDLQRSSTLAQGMPDKSCTDMCM